MDYFLAKLPFLPWRTSVSQRIEMTINSFLYSKSLGTDVMAYSMTKNPKIYKKIIPSYSPWKLIMPVLKISKSQKQPMWRNTEI